MMKTDLDNSIDAKRHGTDSPSEHHQARQSICLLLFPIVPYLWNQLDTPKNGTNGAEDVGRDRDFALRCHCAFFFAVILSGEKKGQGYKGLVGEL